MKRTPVLLIAIGLLALIIGGTMNFTGSAPKASPALVQQCQEKMRARNADDALVRQCSEAAFATAMTATDAQAAAQAISTANNSEVGGGFVAMFLVGLGLALFLGGILAWRKQRG